MDTYFISDNNQEHVKELLCQLLGAIGNTTIGIIKQANMVKIIEKFDVKAMVSLEEKIIDVEESLYTQKNGVLYKSILELVEKPMIEYVLERTEGNQLKAARILGINRNTMRSKIRKLGINCAAYRQ